MSPVNLDYKMETLQEKPEVLPEEPIKKQRKKYTLTDKALEAKKKGASIASKISKERKNIHQQYQQLLEETEKEKHQRELEELDIPILNKKYDILEQDIPEIVMDYVISL